MTTCSPYFLIIILGGFGQFLSGFTKPDWNLPSRSDKIVSLQPFFHRSTGSMFHPDDNQLREFAAGRLDDAEDERIEKHLKSCPDCLRKVTEFERSHANPLLHDVKKGLEESTENSDDEADESSISLPEFIGNYKILSILGGGGMGTVYRAVNPHLNRPAAIKVVKPSRSMRKSSVERFQRELIANGKLHHENIVAAFDAGIFEDRPYLVMELLDGTDLTRYVQENGPLPVKEACEIIRQAAHGLQYAHENGLVHRDIKPSNLFRTKDGKIKILDLGLARLLENETNEIDQTALSSPDATAEGQILGSPDYMSPEQVVNAKNVDHRSDLYSLGCTFFYLLTGTPPFGESTELLAKIDAHAKKELPPLKNFRNDVPPVIENLLRKMTAKKPEDRPGSTTEVEKVLERYLKPSRKRYFALAVISIFLLVILYGAFRPKDVSVVPSSNDSKLSVKQTSSTEDSLHQKDDPATIPIKHVHRIHPDDENWCLTHVLCVGNVLVNTAFLTNKWNGEFNTTYFTADGKGILDADEDDDGVVRLWDIETGKEVRKFTGPDSPIMTTAVSPDRSILASGHKDGTVKLWNIKSGEVVYSYRKSDGPIRSLCISRDNKKLFFLSNDMNLVDLESKTIEKMTLMLKAGTPDHRCGSCFGKDGDYVFFSAHKTLGLCSLKSHKLAGFDRDISDFPILSLKMSPDYQSMAIASGGRDVWIHENVKYSIRWFAFGMT